MVYDAAHAVKIPVIGMGGIQTSEDALEFIMAGATAVSVGTATFSNPLAARDVAVGIKNFMVKNKVEDIKELIGCVSQ
jgi:dihydroorotate dehydrogenase (NAD+) catalytic subunit